jgi:hypothetical protein
MRGRALALLDGMSRLNRRRATIALSERAERARWYYTPNPRRGAVLNQMSPKEQQLTLRLVASGLSAVGYAVASRTMALENVLDRHEGWRGARRLLGGRDPMRYAVAIFGDPAEPVWGWRFEGHHLSLRYTVRDQQVSCTPLFLGGHPARVPMPDGETDDSPLRPGELALELLTLLSSEQQVQAVIASAAPVDIVTSNRAVIGAGARPRSPFEMIGGVLLPDEAAEREQMRRELGATVESDRALELPAVPDGVTRTSMGPEAQARLDRIVECFLGLMPDEVASGYRDVIADDVGPHFAWAGTPDLETGSYFRVRNDRLLIEFNNTQDHANHVHAVWRDPVGDFGRELLGEAAVEVGPRQRSFAERAIGRINRYLDR